MQYMEIVTENVEVFRIPFEQIDYFYLGDITERIEWRDGKLETRKCIGDVYIILNAAATVSFRTIEATCSVA